MMDDMISRQAAIEAVQNRHMMLSKEKVLLINDLEKLPSAQPEPPEECERCMMEHTDEMEKLEAELAMAQPKRGKWIRDGHHIRCDQCGMYMCDTDREGDRIPTEFCPHCGADMREVTT